MSGPVETQRILVTVKTYPQLSRSYGETVCTAGIREDGSWVRIYPVPFRRLQDSQRYSKWHWLELPLIRRREDPRPESFRPLEDASFEPVGTRIDTSYGWRARRELVLGRSEVFTDLGKLIDASKTNTASLAVFKPTRVLDFVVEADEREWDRDRLQAMKDRLNQGDLFRQWEETFRLVRKLPYAFSYRFEDETGRRSELQILDWELGALFWRYAVKGRSFEQTAIAKVREMFFEKLLDSDLHFFMGTRLGHSWTSNPWSIVGVFYPPFERQGSFF